MKSIYPTTLSISTCPQCNGSLVLVSVAKAICPACALRQITDLEFRLVDVQDGLYTAARSVIANWERGDLAGAMADLEAEVVKFRERCKGLEYNTLSKTIKGDLSQT